MIPSKLYLIGAVLIAAGVGFIMEDTRRHTLEELRTETVWTEADKEVIGDSTDASTSG